MSDTSSIIWEGPAHTFAKHRILENYLKAWIAILSKHYEKLGISGAELLFVDGFAGPGCYTGGQNGSPILAIELVLSHSQDLHIPISFLFIEEVKNRYDNLRKVIAQFERKIAESHRIKSVKVEKGNCEVVLSKFLNNRKKANQSIGPAFFFLDQSGFSDVSMQLIQRIMSQPQCEVFSYLNWDHMNRFITDETKWASLDRTFGGPEWRPALGLESHKRSVFMLKAYKTALEEKGNSKYVWHFAMCDTNNKLLYWLFFSTNNPKGLEEMKRAMWKVDSAGGFRFSDKDNPSQLSLFGDYQNEMLAEDLSATLQKKILTVSQVKEFILTETPAYKYKTALKILEERELLKVRNAPPKRRKGTFPDKYMDQIQLVFLADITTSS